jgi:F-type H+-transporting ATPase subunit delta
VAHQQQIVAGVAGRYALALYELAKEAQAVEETGALLEQFQALIETSEDLARLVRSPVYSVEEQVGALKALLEAMGIGGFAANLILLAAKNRRLAKIEEIIQTYRKLLAEERGEIAADVISAEQLSAAQLEILKGELAATLGQNVQITTHTDPEILGGLILKYRSKMIDDSLKTKLQNLKIMMKGVG